MMKRLKIVSYFWGCFVILVYPYIRQVSMKIKYAFTYSGDPILKRGAIYVLVIFAIITLLIYFALYLVCGKCIDVNKNNFQIKNYINTGSRYCAIGMATIVVLFHMIINIMEKFEPFFLLVSILGYAPFADLYFTNLVRDITMIAISLLLLYSCIFRQYMKMAMQSKEMCDENT